MTTGGYFTHLTPDGTGDLTALCGHVLGKGDGHIGTYYVEGVPVDCQKCASIHAAADDVSVGLDEAAVAALVEHRVWMLSNDGTKVRCYCNRAERKAIFRTATEWARHLLIVIATTPSDVDLDECQECGGPITVEKAAELGYYDGGDL